MTDEELKKIARFFAVATSNGDALDPHIDFAEEYAAEVVQWLLKRFCIVPKELIRKEYEKAKSTHDLYTSATCINETESRAIDHAEGRMCELTALFGKDMFEEEGK